MNKLKITLVVISFVVFTIGCSKVDNISEYEGNNNDIQKNEQVVKNAAYEEKLIEDINEKYKIKEPTQCGEKLDKVVNTIDTSEKEIALTFDACGGEYGSGYDKELIDFLIKENIKATLFVNYRWIESNKEIFLELANNPLFEIENHGYLHRPLSVTENSIYNIEGTNSVEEVINEIKLNEKAIYELTGIKTKYFRSGTAYYDEVAIDIAEELGYKIAGYSINGDGGTTFSKSQIESEVSKSKAGDIVICHFNQPEKYTYEGLKNTLIKLMDDGYKFVRLDKK